jgi:isoleucyl-tRNA synthetase
MLKYNEYKKLNLSSIGKEIGAYWEKNDVFTKSLQMRQGQTPWVFYEGPPSANGKPGIHHVMSRAIKGYILPLPYPEGLLGKPQGRLGYPWTAG